MKNKKNNRRFTVEGITVKRTIVRVRLSILQRLKTLGWSRHRLATETKLRPATVYNYLKAIEPADVESEKVERMLSALGLEIRPKDRP